MTKRALITGITGQDGSYLAELLLEKGYEVHGLIRRTSSPNLERIGHLVTPERDQKIHLHQGDLSDAISLRQIVDTVQPHEIYNLGAMSDVKISFGIPEYTADVDGLGTLRLLETIRSQVPATKFYQASTSELFGKVQEVPQTEKTPFYPRSPYAVAKLYAYWNVVNYREAYNLYACNGILFNHESPRRGENFVSRKITKAVAHIHAGLQETLILGNLNAKRDWGYAKDFVEGMWLMLQQKTPDDFVLATGTTTTVREFVELAFAEIGVSLVWEGEGLKEKGIDPSSGKIRVAISSDLFRPTEVDLLIGSHQKAQDLLGWHPRTSLEELVSLMMQADLSKLSGFCSVGRA